MNGAGGVLTAVLAGPRTGAPTVLALSRSDTPPVTTPREAAREAARRELFKRMYHENDPGLVQRALNAFWDWIDRMFGAASASTPGGTLGLVVIVLAAMAVVAALWWRLGTPRRTRASSATLFDNRPRSAAEHRAAAEAHAAQGHWNQAVQERMRAVVRSLEERALLDPRPGRTADEAAAEASHSLPSHTDRLRASARDFDDITYGGRSGDPRAYQRLTELDRDLERTRPVLTDNAPGPHRNTAHDSRRGATS
ncbi:DUF4129 domain-containing protein [Streptomyces sp. NPDC127066]|uniref:DUF4129 domain-containing protein n=1 Tax=Streptomyces sp. NPDC127066 TaxID=3347125 RepID=UPI00365A1F37